MIDAMHSPAQQSLVSHLAQVTPGDSQFNCISGADLHKLVRGRNAKEALTRVGGRLGSHKARTSKAT